MLEAYYAMAASQIFQAKEWREKWLQEIKDEWQKTYDMPRKMKKAKRKLLRTEWAIANYDPFDMSAE